MEFSPSVSPESSSELFTSELVPLASIVSRNCQARPRDTLRVQPRCFMAHIEQSLALKRSIAFDYICIQFNSKSTTGFSFAPRDLLPRAAAAFLRSVAGANW
jgi:hypothetical protein